ncbi:hypothetical protein COLO4_06732 [Corchorus olitorius]|uniref:Uncharacterized protein n=1 Tax=Corchorus olitorius TaxID=93759 RepID=A0A1R3KM58_9ROSI|nr:hypothetical protein COLO4_06732 [Corchorus olitorius]
MSQDEVEDEIDLVQQAIGATGAAGEEAATEVGLIEKVDEGFGSDEACSIIETDEDSEPDEAERRRWKEKIKDIRSNVLENFEREWDIKVYELKKNELDAAKELMKKDKYPKQWTRAFFGEQCKCYIVDNNGSYEAKHKRFIESTFDDHDEEEDITLQVDKSSLRFPSISVSHEIPLYPAPSSSLLPTPNLPFFNIDAAPIFNAIIAGQRHQNNPFFTVSSIPSQTTTKLPVSLQREIVLKNLVFGVVGSINIVDGSKVELGDLGNNFMETDLFRL